ncbi:unnamed protein product [Lactuca virosa]|uniref:Uncharacterized protein n=1 Tax=Lactuca virosa TaxID=75947 RepID=A0AAU9MJ07_9ASTR|nr:unnamed protein product [Lactuca virosa]
MSKTDLSVACRRRFSVQTCVAALFYNRLKLEIQLQVDSLYSWWLMKDRNQLCYMNFMPDMLSFLFIDKTRL